MTKRKKVALAVQHFKKTVAEKLLVAGFYRRNEYVYSRNEINVILSVGDGYELNFNGEWTSSDSAQELLDMLDRKIEEWIKVPFDGVIREMPRFSEEEISKILEEAKTEEGL